MTQNTQTKLNWLKTNTMDWFGRILTNMTQDTQLDRFKPISNDSKTPNYQGDCFGRN